MKKQSERSASTLPSVVFSDNSYKIYEAVKNIQSGLCNRMDVGDRIKVYRCKNVIRIDVKDEY